MTNFASAKTSKPLEFLNFVPTQPTQDTDLIKQLPFMPGLKEVLMLRQVHALEHATVWILSEDYSQIPGGKGQQIDNQLLGGLSTEQGFYLYGQVHTATLRHAVRVALQRLTAGEWNLALHPRCGTNLSVGILLTAGLVLGTHLMLPRGPIEQMLGLGVAAAMAAQLTPDLGILAQRYVTTAIPFNLSIADIAVTRDVWGRSAHFVRVSWAEREHLTTQLPLQK